MDVNVKITKDLTPYDETFTYKGTVSVKIPEWELSKETYERMIKDMFYKFKKHLTDEFKIHTGWEE